MRITTLAAFTALLLTAPAVSAPQQSAQSLSLDGIYGPTAPKAGRPIISKWLAGGNAYTTVEKTQSGGFDLVKYDTATGSRSILVDARQLVPEGATIPIAIDDYQWSPNGRQLLVLARAPTARRNDPVGDYWLFDIGTKALRRIGASAAPGTLLHAEFSPDGNSIAYVSRNNLYVETLASGAVRQLTRDGSDLILNGRSDVVYEEEFRLGKAYAWSPDSKRIAYWRFDTEGVGTFYMIKNTDGLYSKVIPQQYPKPGTTNSAVKVGTVDAGGGDTTWFKLDGDPRQTYVPRMSWADNSSEVIIQHMNRKQNNNRVMIGAATDGSVRQIFADEDSAWVDANDEPQWLRGGRYFTWLSERDGWRHLYLVSRDGRKVELRTPGAYDVVRVENIDDKGGYVYFIASPKNVTQRYLFRAKLDGNAAPQQLTPVSDAGYHSYDIAPNARWAFHTVSSFDAPPVTDVVALPGHRATRPLVNSPELRTLVAQTPHSKAEFFKVDIGGGVSLDAWMIRPPSFDPSKRYPMLMYVYSEPAGQTVADRWGGDRYLWHLMLAQQGYIVASVDSRGAASPRGRAWRKGIYGQIGIQASADQAAAIRAMIATRPYIDPARIGVWGSSGGGAMTLNAMFRYPDLYATGVALAAPSNQRLYNSIYQERYMGLPSENARGYYDGSPINFAQNLKGNLLIVHGTADDNVHYQNTEQLVDTLIAHNKQFSMMAYPDRTHGISEKPNTRLHLFTMITNYLHGHLPPGGR